MTPVQSRPTSTLLLLIASGGRPRLDSSANHRQSEFTPGHTAPFQVRGFPRFLPLRSPFCKGCRCEPKKAPQKRIYLTTEMHSRAVADLNTPVLAVLSPALR
jgi:hypothetical protein